MMILEKIVMKKVIMDILLKLMFKILKNYMAKRMKLYKKDI